QLGLDVDELVAGEDARERRLADAVLDRGDELLRNAALDDAVLERDALGEVETLGLRLFLGAGVEVDDDVAELAAAAGLLDELAADVLRGAGDRLAVRHAGLADLDVHLHVAEQLVLDDLQVELTHARDDGLAGLVVVVRAEG